METATVLFILLAMTFVMAPWFGYLNQKDLYPHIDTMAGDEGED